MTGARPLLRLAWRDARRDRWRTVLVVALVAIPVGLLGAAITYFETITPSPEERASDLLGQADVLIRPTADAADDVVTKLRERLPDGVELEAIAFGRDQLRLPGERIEVRLTDTPIHGDALGVGRYRLLEGRAPGAGEVVLTEHLASTLESEIGDRLELAALGTVEVTGVARRLERLDEPMVLLSAGSLTAPEALAPVGLVEVLAGLDDQQAASAVSELRSELTEEGVPRWQVLNRDQVLADRFTSGERTVAVIVGGLAAVEVALIVGATFAVSVRRRQRELGLLTAVGGNTGHVRRAVLLTGGTAGAAGAALGTLLGVLATLLAFPWLQTLVNRELTGLRVDPAWLLSVALLGVGATLAGAWWPARSVARLPTMVALSGRRPPPQPSPRGLQTGLALVTAGLTVLTLAIAFSWQNPYVFLLGSVAPVLGVGLASPWLLLQLGRLAPRLPVGPRLAVRDAARFRTRNGPILTAATAGLAASLTVATIVTSLDASDAARHRPMLERDLVAVSGEGAPAVADVIAAELGGQPASYRLTDLYATDLDADDQPASALSPGQLHGTITAGHHDLADLLVGPEAVAALDRGEVVLLGQDAEQVEIGRRSQAGPVVDDPTEGTEPEQATIGEFAAASFPLGDDLDPTYANMPTILVPPELVDPGAVHGQAGLVRLPAPVDDETHSRIVAIAADAPHEVFVQTERGYRSPVATVLTVTLIVGALTGLALVGIAIALAAAETRSDLRTLQAVGGDRRTRRALAAGRALLLAGLGGILALPVGLVPAIAVILRLDHLHLTVPWPAIFATTVVVPTMATATAAIAATRDPGISVRTAA